MTKAQRLAERAADAAASRARDAKPGQKMRTRVLAEIARTRALVVGNRVVRRST